MATKTEQGQQTEQAQTTEMTEAEKQALVNSLFEFKPKSRRQRAMERLDGQLSAND